MLHAPVLKSLNNTCKQYCCQKKGPFLSKGEGT